MLWCVVVGVCLLCVSLLLLLFCRWLCGVVARLLLSGGLLSDVETYFGYLREDHG